MESSTGWQSTDCAGLELCRAGETVQGLRLLGWQEVLPRSLAAVLAPGAGRPKATSSG
ncbi:hypothetical protein [Streptomyces sp. NPDC090112]|uniref:hypothetical protein n=1 Tax=Streptomyces sp. NPDC090112 TaxID=3365949 RepID=UPI003805BBA2